MKKRYIIWMLCCFYLAAGCSDKLEAFDPVVLTPQIQISGIDNSVAIQKGLGEILDLNPIAKLEDSEDDFSYTWYRLLNNQMKKISDEQHLLYTLDTLGFQQYRLEVSHRLTNTKTALIATVNVTSNTQNGWYVLKENNDGNTDMDLIQLAGDGLKCSQSDMLSTRLGNALSGKPVGLGFTTTYFWSIPGSTAQRNQQAIIIKSTQGSATFRPTDARIMTRGTELFYENPASYYPFKAMISTPYQQYDLTSSGQALYMRSSAGSYMPPRTGNYRLGPYMTQPATNVWNDYPMVLAFDENTSSFVYLKRDTVGLGYFPNNYISGMPKISSNNMNGKLVFLENTAGGIDPANLTASGAYGLFEENGQRERMKLYGFALSELNENLRKGHHSPIVWEKTLLKSSYAELLEASHRALDKSSPILYFVNGKNIGFYDIKNDSYKPDWYSISIPGEITYFKYLDVPHPSIPGLTLKHLVVSYASNGNYQIVRYLIKNNQLQQELQIVIGQGKVRNMMVASSNTTNMNSLLSRYQ